ncbi:MAG: hypothetical protein GY853_13205 [PVC group bacterium]|nr:hypothetical protein [PVC group bacterium]
MNPMRLFLIILLTTGLLLMAIGAVRPQDEYYPKYTYDEFGYRSRINIMVNVTPTIWPPDVTKRPNVSIQKFKIFYNDNMTVEFGLRADGLVEWKEVK